MSNNLLDWRDICGPPLVTTHCFALPFTSFKLLDSNQVMFDHSTVHSMAVIRATGGPQESNAVLKTFGTKSSAIKAKLVSEVASSAEKEIENKRYKDKCHRLQKQVRHLIYLNSAIQSELSQCSVKLSEASEDRRFLLNKILRFHKDNSHENISSRILQEALSKKTTKLSNISWPSHNSIINCSKSSSQTISSSESDLSCAQSSQPLQSAAKSTTNQSIQSVEWTPSGQSLSANDSEHSVAPKRIKSVPM